MRTQARTRKGGGALGVDRAIAELAEKQHGIVSRTQLLELGLASGAIGRRLRAGRLHPLHRGVYAVGHQVVSLRGRWMAAILACGHGAVLSHRTAAMLWGIRGSSGRAIEVTTHVKSGSHGAIQRHFAVLPADEVATAHRIPVTTVPRTLFDLASVLAIDAVERALRESERLRLYDALSLEDLLKRYPGHRGNRAIRECLRRRLELPVGTTREELEARFLSFLSRVGIPRPRLNAWIDLGAHRYQADCHWPGQRVIVELDGYETHGTRAAFERDRARDRRLTAAGYRGIRITWHQLHEAPGEIEADLRSMLGGIPIG